MNSDQKLRRRLALWQAGKRKCWICRRQIAFSEMTLDHVMPKSKGGTDALANLRPAHRHCNELKGDDVPAFLAGAVSDDGRIDAQKRDEE